MPIPRPERKWWTLLVICTGIFMLLLDITIVNIALPDLVKSLHASFSDLQWVIDAYALSLAALQLIAGSLGDLYGARAMFFAGLAVFTVSSLFCGLALGPVWLITCRAVQGIGGSAMFATSLALLAHEFHGRDRGVALGAWGATAGAAIAVGPLVGGALTSGLSWRWIFLVNVPIGVCAGAATLARVREAPRRPGVRPDWAGFAALSGALVAGVYGLIRGNPDGWTSPGILAAFGASAVLLAAFLAIEHRQRQPMLELGLFRNPALVGASVAALVISATLFSILLYVTLYLQNILGYSAFQTGVRFLPLSALVLLASPAAGRASARVPPGILIGAGLALAAAGLGLMTMVSPASGWTALLAGMVVAGIGSGLTKPRSRLRGRRHRRPGKARGWLGHQQHVPAGRHRRRDRGTRRDLLQPRAHGVRTRPDQPRAPAQGRGEQARGLGHDRWRAAGGRAERASRPRHRRCASFSVRQRARPDSVDRGDRGSGGCGHQRRAAAHHERHRRAGGRAPGSRGCAGRAPGDAQRRGTPTRARGLAATPGAWPARWLTEPPRSRSRSPAPLARAQGGQQ